MAEACGCSCVCAHNNSTIEFTHENCPCWSEALWHCRKKSLKTTPSLVWYRRYDFTVSVHKHHLKQKPSMKTIYDAPTFYELICPYLPLIKSKYSNLLLKFVPVDTACSGFMTSSARYGPQHRWWYSDMTKTWFTLDLPFILHSWSFMIWWNHTFWGGKQSSFLATECV